MEYNKSIENEFNLILELSQLSDEEICEILTESELGFYFLPGKTKISRNKDCISAYIPCGLGVSFVFNDYEILKKLYSGEVVKDAYYAIRREYDSDKFVTELCKKIKDKTSYNKRAEIYYQARVQEDITKCLNQFLYLTNQSRNHYINRLQESGSIKGSYFEMTELEWLADYLARQCEQNQSSTEKEPPQPE